MGDCLISRRGSTLDTTDATAVASDIKSGKTAYVNGAKITGSAHIIASGTVVSSDNTVQEYFWNGSSAINCPYVQLSYSGLAAAPTAIIVIPTATKSLSSTTFYEKNSGSSGVNTIRVNNALYYDLSNGAAASYGGYVGATNAKLPVGSLMAQYDWYAIA